MRLFGAPKYGILCHVYRIYQLSAWQVTDEGFDKFGPRACKWKDGIWLDTRVAIDKPQDTQAAPR